LRLDVHELFDHAEQVEGAVGEAVNQQPALLAVWTG
jgi:hypothetical protein